jgi:dolichol-phosphate mannosyltransferase
MRTVVCLPTYEERENLPALVEELLRTAPVDLLIMDDASPDGTGQLADELAAHEPRLRVRHGPGRRGIARAYQEALQAALDEGYDQVVQMDADFSHQPRYLPLLLEALTTADVAVGSRYARGGQVEKWSLSRRLVSSAANLYASSVLQLPCRDSTAGFVAYRRHVLEAIDFGAIASDGAALQVALKYRAHRLGFTVVEVPIHVWDRVVGSSKLDVQAVTSAAWQVLQLRVQDMVEP